MNSTLESSMLCTETVIPYVLAFLTRERVIDGLHHKEILLLYRSDTNFGNDHYSMIGGKIHQGESLKIALIRELSEEVGIEVLPENVHLAHVMHFQGATQICIAFVFSINDWQGEPYNKEPEKHGHINWFDVHQLPDNILPRHGKMIKSVMQGSVYSEEGLA